MITIKTSSGNIQIELYEKEAPATCANFLNYVNSGFYDGTIFHRVIKGFMIQGGGFTTDMEQKPTGDPIKNEADNGLENSMGTLAMARTSDPHSATVQFFINAKNNDFLNYSAPNESGWGYCVFAKVVEGMDIVQQIENVETGDRAGHRDVPIENIIIESISIAD